MSNLGLILGEGELAQNLFQICAQKKMLKAVVSLTPNTYQNVNNFCSGIPFLQASVGEIGRILNFLKQYGVQSLTLAGRIPRPTWSTLRVDKVGSIWLGRLGTALFKGDDTLLSGVVELLKKEGFDIFPPIHWLSSLEVSMGVLTKCLPELSDWDDIQRGFDILKGLSHLDIAQSVVIQKGLVLGIESIEGTDALIQRSGLYKQSGGGGVLVKGIKNGQSLLVDRPTIGQKTIEILFQAGLVGAAIHVPWTQVVNSDVVIAECDRLGIFLVGKKCD